MIQVKTTDGYKLPDNIFYKNGDTFVQVKKVFSNQRVLERTTICSCEKSTSQLIKSLKATILTYKDLIKYLGGEELASAINTIAELENEVNSLKIDQLIYNQQLTIIDNDRHLRNEFIPAVYGLNLITEKVMSNTPTSQIVVKIVVGSNTYNPDIMFSPLPSNMFKFDGDYYYIGNQSDQVTILEDITAKFGVGKVALQVYSSNELIDILRVTVKERAELNISQLKKIGIQQNLIDSAINTRRLEVLNNPLLESINTDNAVKDFYGVNSITEVLSDNIISTAIKTNSLLKLDNMVPGVNIDVKSMLFPFTISALNTKTDDILGYVNLVKNVKISSVLSSTELVQIYNSTDIHEFKFSIMGRVATGVHYNLDSGTLTETHQHSRITSTISDGKVNLLSFRKVKYHPRDLDIDSSIISEVSDRLLTMSDSVKLSSGVKPITMLYDDIPVTTDPTWTGGVNYTISGTPTSPIVTTTGQFASALWKMSGYGRTGKVYFEVKTLSKSGVERGIFIGIQRTPTRKGNYHEGNYDNPNVNGGEAVSYITLSGTTIGITVDLDTSSLYINGVLRGSLSNTGPIYFGVYDGASAGNGSLQLLFDESKFTLERPNNVTPWYGSSLSLIETDLHSKIISNTTNNLLQLPSMTKSVGFNAEIISEVVSGIITLSESVKPSSNTNYIISEVGSKASVIDIRVYKDTTPHTRVISRVSDTFTSLQEEVLTTAFTHDRIISIISNKTHQLTNNTAMATSHPELSTPQSDDVHSISGKVKLDSVIIPIISNIESPIMNVLENVKVVNDPIPFTVYQQSVGEVKQFDKPIMEPSSIDIYVSSVKNIGSMSRISPITVISDKVPNYISTQTNMNDELTYYDSVQSIKTIENYVVSQVTSVYTSQVFDKPTIVAESFELFVTESKSVNVASFGDVIEVLPAPADRYIASKVSGNVSSFDGIVSCTTTNDKSDAIIDIKSVKPITFSNSVLELSTDSVDKVIDIKSIKTISFENNVLELSTSSVDKVIDIKSVKPITFSNNVDMTLNSEGSAFIISNGLTYSASDSNEYLVVVDTTDGKHYAIIRDASGIIESYETDLPITNNNYLYDEITKKMYKVTSTSGFLDISEM